MEVATWNGVARVASVRYMVRHVGSVGDVEEWLPRFCLGVCRGIRNFVVRMELCKELLEGDVCFWKMF